MTSVAVVGPGRVGGALALALRHAGYRVDAVAGRPGSASLARFRTLLPEAAEQPVAKVGQGVDLVLVTVPDDQVEAVVAAAARADAVRQGSRWVHTAGGLGLAPLRLAVAAGARAAALHPAMTFPDAITGADTLPGTAWAVTAAKPDLGWARVLVTDLRGSPVTVAEHNRALYHAGLTVGANGTSSVVVLARDLLLGAGVEDPAAFLGPLVTVAARTAADRGVDALTGPVRRGDAGTVGRHLAELRGALPEAVDAYLVLARLALAHARRAGLDDDRARAVAAALRLGGPEHAAGD